MSFTVLDHYNGFVLNKFIKIINNEIDNNQSNNDLKNFSNILKKNVKTLTDFSNWLEEKNKNKKDDVSSACNDFLKVLGYISLGFAWFKMTKVSLKKTNENKNFYEEKINTAKYYFEKISPRIESHYNSAISGSESLMKAKFN